MAGRVVNLVPSIVEPVRTGRVQPPEVPVNPRKPADDRDTEPAERQETGRHEEEHESGRDPYRAGEDDEGG